MPLVTSSSNLFETWPRGVVTAEREYRATRDRKRSINVFSSEETSVKETVAMLYLFVVLRIGLEYDLRQKMSP